MIELIQENGLKYYKADKIDCIIHESDSYNNDRYLTSYFTDYLNYLKKCSPIYAKFAITDEEHIYLQGYLYSDKECKNRIRHNKAELYFYGIR